MKLEQYKNSNLDAAGWDVAVPSTDSTTVPHTCPCPASLEDLKPDFVSLIQNHNYRMMGLRFNFGI